jgi:hypothetical protein
MAQWGSIRIFFALMFSLLFLQISYACIFIVIHRLALHELSSLNAVV